jgi:hypothetical protein
MPDTTPVAGSSPLSRPIRAAARLPIGLDGPLRGISIGFNRDISSGLKQAYLAYVKPYQRHSKCRDNFLITLRLALALAKHMTHPGRNQGSRRVVCTNE